MVKSVVCDPLRSCTDFPLVSAVFGDERGSKKSADKRRAMEEKEVPRKRIVEDDFVTEFITDQKIVTDRRDDRKASPQKVNSGRSSSKEHKSRDSTTIAMPSKHSLLIAIQFNSSYSHLTLVGNSGLNVMSGCEKVSDAHYHCLEWHNMKCRHILCCRWRMWT